MTKQHFEFLKANVPSYKRSEGKVIEDLVNKLIQALYIPVLDDRGFTSDPDRIRFFNIREEPINWGNLHCFEAKKFEDGSFLVTIDEASPGGCPTFCDYIQRHVKLFGWTVRVETEW